MKPLAPRCAHRVTVIEDFGVSALLMVVPERPQEIGKCCASKHAGGVPEIVGRRNRWPSRQREPPGLHASGRGTAALMVSGFDGRHAGMPTTA
jgi:hypothetical protein